MKKKILTLFLTATLGMSLLAGCGNKSDTASKSTANEAYTTYAAADNEIFSEDSYEAYEFDNSIEADGDLSFAYGENGTTGNAVKQVKEEMLVFRCQMSIDTTEFDNTLTNLRNKINEYGGLVEDEYLTDNTSTSGKYIKQQDERQRYYKITVRIPSKNYQDFVSSAQGLGILRNKTATVDDMTQVYGTLGTTLAIYEADYERYLQQYEETKDESARIILQDDLRELALDIASIKTQMSSIENDVAYSYVTITINEFFEMPEIVKPEPKPDPTFSERFKEHAKESWDSFLEFCEDALYFIMDTWWGFVIFALIVLAIIAIIRLIIKLVRKSNSKRREKEEAEKIKRAKEKEEKAKAVDTVANKPEEAKK